VESTLIDILRFGDSQGKSTRGWLSKSRSLELQKVLALMLGCGHIGKGAEEGAYTLSHLQFHVSDIPRAVALHSKFPTRETRNPLWVYTRNSVNPCRGLKKILRGSQPEGRRSGP
jgi:hypothetical protein